MREALYQKYMYIQIDITSAGFVPRINGRVFGGKTSDASVGERVGSLDPNIAKRNRRIGVRLASLASGTPHRKSIA